MQRKVALLLCAFIFCLWSCGKPVIDSAYCNFDIKTGWTEPATLTLEMTDSINPCKIDICLQIAMHNMEEHSYCPVIINIESPNRQRYTDTLQLPLHIMQEKSVYRNSNGYTILHIPYRKSVITKECGEWNFTFVPYPQGFENNTEATEGKESIYKAITRIGISCKKEIEQ